MIVVQQHDHEIKNELDQDGHAVRKITGHAKFKSNVPSDYSGWLSEVHAVEKGFRREAQEVKVDLYMSSMDYVLIDRQCVRALPQEQ